MQKIKEKIVFSASDLVHFLECEHLSALDRLHLDVPMIRTSDSEEAQLIQNRGFEHEKTYLAQIKSSAETFIDIATTGDSRDARVAATTRAMQEGIDLIYQASFFDLPFVGYADFLKRVDKPSTLGNYSYEVIDTKLSKSAKAKFIIQLAFYADLMERIQGVAPDFVHIVLGDGRQESYQLMDYRYYYLALKERFLVFMAKGESIGVNELVASVAPFPCEKCDLCHWRDRCGAHWEKTDHLSQVANILKTHIRKLNGAGVHTVAQLAALADDAYVPNIAAPVLRRLKHQAWLQHRAQVTGTRVVEPILPDLDLPPELGVTGFARMPRPSEHDLFFDMEGYPHLDQGLEYLFGLYYFDQGEPLFKPFWGHDRAGEKKAFEAWVDFVIRHLDAYPDAHIYHYAAYENTAIKKLMHMHGTRENEVDRLLRDKKLVDLYQVVRESIRISEPSYSIKYVEKFYLEARQGDVKSGGSSIVAYEKWRDTQDDTILQDIAHYNEDDVRSTYALQQWLCTLRPEKLSWFGENDVLQDSPDSLQSRSSAALDIEGQVARLHGGLSQFISEDRSAWGVNEAHVGLVRDLLDFHRRAIKPQWWAFFERQLQTAQERLDDVDCIAGAIPIAAYPPVVEKQSLRYSYQYPAQEVKLKTNDPSVHVDTSMSLSGLTVNAEERLITFKLGKNKALPTGPIDIGRGKPIDPGTLQKALWRYAEDLIAAKKQHKPSSYPAMDAILRRDLPVILGHHAGKSLVPENATVDDIVAVIQGLHHSYVFIQGPPGAGKTYIGSRVILALLKAGKRVGVSSNSHKAIVNLLQAVEKEAIATQFSFRGAKKSDLDDPSQLIQGTYIQDVQKKEEVFKGEFDLVAGTAWLFADPEMDQQLDYLFIDEAGQVALGMLIPMATSTRNIVLLGDQMQLAQPVEGVHPGESGKSVLDYLLGGKATIPPEQGIFLQNTWRMHPAICDFISSAVYEGRLLSHQKTETRYLELDSNADSALLPVGIRFEPVAHEGRAQYSQEEVTRVKVLYENLLTQSYMDDEGQKKPLQGHNILVVSPYNMQVILLKQALPPFARVGTVDKFQGQEAEVVIVSMATSSGDELPRNIEFLFSKNRLNVALSRAKCLAILVASPDLTAVHCKTPEQIALVNTLCRIKNSY